MDLESNTNPDLGDLPPGKQGKTNHDHDRMAVHCHVVSIFQIRNGTTLSPFTDTQHMRNAVHLVEPIVLWRLVTTSNKPILEIGRHGQQGKANRTRAYTDERTSAVSCRDERVTWLGLRCEVTWRCEWCHCNWHDWHLRRRSVVRKERT